MSEHSQPTECADKPTEQSVADSIKQGWKVIVSGLFGVLLASGPLVSLLLKIPRPPSPWIYLVPLGWACLAGWVATLFWSCALHDRLKALRDALQDNKLLIEDKKNIPGRLRWMPEWIGIFERAFYSILIGLEVAGAGAFIGVWVGIKATGPWQMSGDKATTYRNATFATRLLGNLMSLTFGISAGLLIRKWRS